MGIDTLSSKCVRFELLIGLQFKKRLLQFITIAEGLFLTRAEKVLVRRGNDLVLVAEVAGHKRLETTRRYSLPSLEDRETAMEGLRMEY